MKTYIKATACYDLPESELNTTPEVIIIADRGEILGRKSFDVKNVKTGAIYRNISEKTLFKS